MSSRSARITCAFCNRVLPRSASYRCPSCLERFQSEAVFAGAVCPRCKDPVPRAHAGKCPCTTVANLNHAEQLKRRKL